MPWAEAIIAMPMEDIVSRYQNLPIEDVMIKLNARAKELNMGNPWQLSTERRDKLRACLGMWKALGTCDKVLSWIAYGKKTTFNKEPENLSFPNANSAFLHHKFIYDEVDKGLKNGTLRLVDFSFAKVINPIIVDRKKKNNKLRMCLDLRYPNSQSAWVRFKLATLLTLSPTS